MVKKRSSCAQQRAKNDVTLPKQFSKLTLMIFILASFSHAISLDEFKAEYKTVESSNDQLARSEGLILEAPPSYIDFKGDDGLKLEVSLPANGKFDYTIMFWFRSNQSYKELSYDDSIRDWKRAYLFEIPALKDNKYDSADRESGAACFITNPGFGPVLRCGALGEESF